MVNEEIKHYAKRNMIKSAFLDLEKYVIKNKSKFVLKGISTLGDTASGDEIGIIEFNKTTTRVYLTKDAFDDFFKNSKYYLNQKSIVSGWKKINKLITDSSTSSNTRNTIRKTINKTVVPTYCFDLVDYDLLDFEK